MKFSPEFVLTTPAASNPAPASVPLESGTEVTPDITPNSAASSTDPIHEPSETPEPTALEEVEDTSEEFDVEDDPLAREVDTRVLGKTKFNPANRARLEPKKFFAFRNVIMNHRRSM